MLAQLRVRFALAAAVVSETRDSEPPTLDASLLAADIMAEVRLKGQTYRNTFYYNPNGMEHHHGDDACPQVSELAEWVYALWDERKPEELD